MHKLKNIGLFVMIAGLPFFTLAQLNFDSLMKSHPVLRKVSSNPEKYHLKIIYTRVNTTTEKPEFLTSVYPSNTEPYSYCASLVKLPVAVLCLRKLNQLGLGAGSILYTDSSEQCHRSVRKDSSSENSYPSINHYLRRMLLVSDNDAYNRCFEFLGTDFIHQDLQTLSYTNIRIINRYDIICPPGKSKSTNPVRVFSVSNKLLYSQPALPIEKKWKAPLKKVQVGKSYMDENKRIIPHPKDFSFMNTMSLEDCHNFLMDLIYRGVQKFSLDTAQKEFLIEQMSLLPRQSLWPRYNSKDYPDNYKKYLYYGDFKEPINDTNLVVTNIVGQSYGFLSDCARFKDTKNGFEFLLSATLYVNEDEILNDGKYEYKQIGLPFLAELGRRICDYELKHKSKN